PSNDLAALSLMIKNHYNNDGTDFVLIIGDDLMVPMFKLKTSGSSMTPSDLKHFTMDGATDNIPDMFNGRIVASTAAQVTSILAKSIEFEKRSFTDMSGMKKFIGIASDEGSGPSDDEYIKSIEDSFAAGIGTSALHLQQADKENSTPMVLNKQFNAGAFWLTYIGHGSGYAWPSMARSYGVADIKGINNKGLVKPIIIDVACMNGKMSPGYFGTTFMSTETVGETNRLGAVAYFGGTVNISWHPPAVMAQGITFEHMKKRFTHLGESILAGQIYLAKNWTQADAVIDNLEWYHLQGDPSLNIVFQP
ncbi:MAG: C25 family cysteine peptidase, partial [Bdellovibrionota bacterium]